MIRSRWDLSASESRLWSLVARRCEPGADKADLDRRIWDLFGEDWAILWTDLTGFSRNVATFGITHFLQIIHEQKALFLPLVEKYDGVLVKIEADSLLLLFRRASSALDCAVAMRAATVGHNLSRPEEEHVLLCCGLGYGRVLRLGDSDVFGAEVNAASKLGEDVAGTGEILLTESARAAVGTREGLEFVAIEDDVAGQHRYFRVSSASE